MAAIEAKKWAPRFWRRPDLPALWAAAFGVVLFLLIYGPSTLNPTYDSWIFAGYINQDVTQHYTGWLAFRQADWAFPLTYTPYLNYPVGGPAALADCIPVLAIPLKLLSGLLPGTFQYFGWFVLLSMGLAGWAGARLLSLFGLSAPGRVLGGLFFAASPVLLERAFYHTALAAQFLVLLGLYFYFKTRRAGFAKTPWGFIGLAAAAVFTHAYFVPMVLALAFAAAVDSLANKGARWQPLVMLAASVAAAALSAFLLGYFQKVDPLPGGYGNFGLNLYAFFNPASYNWAIWSPEYKHLDWSRFLPQRAAAGDSLEGFAYLGLGVLAALLVCVVFYAVKAVRTRKNGPKGPRNGFWNAVIHFIKTHPGLLVACLCLSVFAVSNVVAMGGRVLFSVPLPAAIIRLCDTFRSSGRLIWPVYHLLVLAAVVGLARLAPRRRPQAASYGVIGSGTPAQKEKLERRLAGYMERKARVVTGRATPLLLAAVFCLQLVDLSPALLEKHDNFAQPVVPAAAVPPANWDQIAKNGRVLYQLELNEDRPMALHAAKSGMPSNYYLLARGAPSALNADMAITREHLLEGRLPPLDAVYITRDAELAENLAKSLNGLCAQYTVGDYQAFLPLAANGA